MAANFFKVLISVRAKLFFGFLMMTLLMLLLGGYAFVSIRGASTVVEDTFDRPLMAINFARSAGQVFGDLEIEVLLQVDQRQSRTIMDVEPIAPLLETFKADLAIAKERSISTRANSFFEGVTTNLSQWEALILNADEELNRDDIVKVREISDSIAEQLEIIVELQTNESFLAREAAIEQMAKIERYNLFAGILALALTIALSAWLAVTIINPLKAAAAAARKISAGDLDTKIPPGGDDETGVLLKTLSAMQDNIRQRMDQEKNLRALAQNRLSDAVTNSQDAILLTNAAGEIIVTNPQIERMFPTLKHIDLTHRPLSEYFQDYGGPINEPCKLNESKTEIAFSDGRWARISSSATREGGQLYIWSDITDAKLKSQRLRDAKELAEAADEAKTVFLAAMSHELRTPLNAVIGFSDILRKAYDGPEGNVSHARMATLISQSGAQLLNIVKDVLTIAQGNNPDDLAMTMGAVDLDEVVDFAMQTIATETNETSIQLEWTPSQTPMMVYGDELRLKQMLLNLLSNAVKFNRDHGVVQVRLSRTPSQNVQMDVIDTGIGIARTDIGRVTEPFIQVDQGSSRKYEGVGLGLSIVKQIIAAHGGQMAIHSELGRGTAVSLILPALTQSQLEDATHAA